MADICASEHPSPWSPPPRQSISELPPDHRPPSSRLISSYTAAMAEACSAGTPSSIALASIRLEAFNIQTEIILSKLDDIKLKLEKLWDSGHETLHEMEEAKWQCGKRKLQSFMDMEEHTATDSAEEESGHTEDGVAKRVKTAEKIDGDDEIKNDREGSTNVDIREGDKPGDTVDTHGRKLPGGSYNSI